MKNKHSDRKERKNNPYRSMLNDHIEKIKKKGRGRKIT